MGDAASGGASAATERILEACVRAESANPSASYRPGTVAARVSGRESRWALANPGRHEDVAVRRGAADVLALLCAHSNPEIQLEMRPGNPIGRWVFELLEQFRAESLAGHRWPGAVRNMQRRHRGWAFELQGANGLEAEDDLFLFTVAEVSRARITGQPIPEDVQDLIESTRAHLPPVVAAASRELFDLRKDQRAYAQVARRISDAIAAELLARERLAVTSGAARQASPRHSLTTRVHDWAGESDGDHRPPPGADRPYAVYTSKYDCERHVTALVSARQLREYRKQLDEFSSTCTMRAQRAGRAFHDYLRQTETIARTQEETGRLDPQRLSRVVVAPSDPNIFVHEARIPAPGGVVTLLFDCSGSMKRHAMQVAHIADVLAREIEAAGSECEVLAYTTQSWNGGRAFRDWARAGKPPGPGRVAEALHVVLKDAATSWRDGRRSIAGLLHGPVYKEGIDGEAVAWACRRLRERPALRHLLIVFSDGSPMERATAVANGDDDYLAKHLRRVVDAEARSDIAVLGVGFGADIGHIYRNALQYDADRAEPAGLVLELASRVARLHHITCRPRDSAR